jgi:hypothetical protein
VRGKDVRSVDLENQKFKMKMKILKSNMMVESPESKKFACPKLYFERLANIVLYHLANLRLYFERLTN